MAKTPTGWTDADGNPTYVEDQPTQRKHYSIATGNEGGTYKVEPSEWKKAEPTVGESVGAYSRQYNGFYSYLADKTFTAFGRLTGDNWDNPAFSNRFDGTFDFDTEMAKHPDLEAYKDKLATANNKERFNVLVDQIRMETTDKETIDHTEGFVPNAVGIVASAIDPTLLIPGTAIVKGGKAVSTIAKTVMASGAIGAATGYLQGELIDQSQMTSDGDASTTYAAFGAVGGALFGGWVGTRAAQAMSTQSKQNAINALIQTQNPNPAAHLPPVTTGNAGAAKVNHNVIPDGEVLPVIEGAAKVREAFPFKTPNLELATSESTTSRRIGQELGNNALYTTKNFHGVATPQSFELNTRHLTSVLEGKLATSTRDTFQSFKTGWKNMPFTQMADELRLAGRNITAQELANSKPTKELFHELVAVASRNGDKSAVHEVALASKATREVYEQLGTEANNQNLFLNLHKQAERNAYKEAAANSPAAKISIQAVEDHANKLIAKQAAQLVYLKDQLYALKQLGKGQSQNALRLEQSIQRSEQNLINKGADSIVKQAHQDFADRLKAIGADVTDINTRKKISRELFSLKRTEVSDAALTKRAAKENLENFAQQQAKAARAASEALQPTTAASYLPRMWDVEKIMANEQEFKRIIMDHYISKGVPDDDAFILTEALYQKMVDSGKPVTKGTPELASTSFGSLSARSIDIPDNLVGKFLINDHEYVTRRYIQDMVRAIEFDKAFNGRSMKEVLEDVTEDYKLMRREVYRKALPDAEQTKAIEKLNKAELSDKSNLTHLYNTLMSTGKEIDFISASTSTAIKQMTNITSLGQIVAASLADLGRVVSITGFGKPLKALVSMLNPAFRKLTIEEAEQFGYGFERLLSTRANQLIDVGTNVMEYRPGHIKGSLNWASSKFHELTLFNRWNSSMKHLAGTIHADKSMKAILDYDNLDSSAKAYLAQTGIDRDMAGRISAQFQKFGVEEKGFKFGNTSLWDDEIAKTTYQRSVFKLTNHTIMTPDAGTVPKVFKSNIGSVVTQFMSFAMATEEQMIAAGIQRHSANEIKGLLTMFAMGVAGVMLKDKIANKEDREINDLLVRGIDATGIFGVAGMINEKMHVGGLGVQDFLDDEDERHVDGMRVVSAVAGPGISKAAMATTALVNVANGTANNRDRSDIWKAVPGNNIWAVKALAERYGEDVNNWLGE